MAVFSGITMTKLNAEIPVPEPGSLNGSVKVFNEEYVVLGSEATTDTIEVGKLPKGARLLFGIFQMSDVQSTSTVAIGITGTTGKYRAAAVIVPNVPEVFGVNQGDVLAAEETIIITIAVADFDTADVMRVKLFYTLD